MVAVELEVLAKKFDRFGWERDRGSAAHDRLMLDWIDALSDFPLREIQEACRDAVRDCPDRMPNEGHVLQRIVAKRAEVRRNAAREAEYCAPAYINTDTAEERKASANRIMAEVYGAKKMPGAEA